MKDSITGYFINHEFQKDFGTLSFNTDTGLIESVQSHQNYENNDFDEQTIIFPGFIDLHIHAREDQTQIQNYKEDYHSASLAALNGGVGVCCAMPNTPRPLTTIEDLDWHQQQHKKENVRFINYAGVGPGTLPISVTVPYKVYTGPSVGPLFFKNEKELRETLKHYQGESVSFHVEDYDLLMANQQQKTHNLRRPVECVEKALEYVLKIIEEFNLKAKLCHWSCGEKSFEMIQKHRDKGYPTTIEVSPIHLYFDCDQTKNDPTLWPFVQMNPSIQNSTHRKALIQALKNGFIDYLATDHAPHTLEEKLINFKDLNHHKTPEENFLEIKNLDPQGCIDLACRNGISGTPLLDTYAPFVTWLIHEHDFSLQRIVQITSFNAAQFIKPYLHKEESLGYGAIQKDFVANFTILNLDNPTMVTRDSIKSKAGWSPFEGDVFPGSLVKTIVRGKPHD